MAADTPLSYDAHGLHGARGRGRVLERLNRTVDRLFGFELQADELRHLADPRKLVERTPALDGAGKRPSRAGGGGGRSAPLSASRLAAYQDAQRRPRSPCSAMGR